MLVGTKSWVKDSIILLTGLCLGLVLSGLFKSSGTHDNKVLVDLVQHMDADSQEVAHLREQSEVLFQSLTDKCAKLQSQSIEMSAQLNTLAQHFKVQLDASTSHTPNNQFGFDGSDLNLFASLASLEYQLAHKQQKLQALEELAKVQWVGQKTQLSGRASIVKGWISSYYGQRVDPLTGNKKWHSGVDIGSLEGREVTAVASGIVTFAGEKGGYGNTLEVSHGNGLLTRYAHNQCLLVKEGDVVHQGTPIAKVGSTGRATGPHVHFEVREQGIAVDPGKYFPHLSRKA